MRIALFADTYPPRVNGVATSVYLLAKYMENMGHEVLVVTSADPEVSQPEDNIIRIPSIPFKTQRLATVAGPMVYADITKFKPDIIHTHAEFTLGILGRFMAATLRKSHVHTMHTVWEYYTRHITDIDLLEPVITQAARKYTALICNRADRVIAPTAKVEDLLQSYNVRKEIIIIPTGIEIERFAPHHTTPEHLAQIRNGIGLTPSDKVLINICRIEKEKNLEELIELLRDYLLGHDDVKLVLVGDGTARVQLEQYAADTGLEKSVIFTGQRPWDEINRYYRLGDVFVSASVSETQGLTYTEAMASGLPVVAKRDRCLENLLVDGENGFMFDDAVEMTKAIDTLLANDMLRSEFSEKAAQSAQKFSSQAYAENVLTLYNELLEEKG